MVGVQRRLHQDVRPIWILVARESDNLVARLKPRLGGGRIRVILLITARAGLHLGLKAVHVEAGNNRHGQQ